MNHEVISNAIRIAATAHINHVDKGGKPYILHPLRVMWALEKDGHGPEVLAAAVLHDVIEDCEGWDAQRLRDEGVDEFIVIAVEHLSHDMKNHEPYDQYLWRLGRNETARIVKRADVLDNLSPLRLHQLPEEDRQRLTKKYHLALTLLDGSEAMTESFHS